MPPRTIALLTDFGAGDAYVAAMKGAIYSGHPAALVVDVTHEIPRHDIRSAAYALHCVEEYFPKGTIFVCVVDPGVGTGRPVLLLERRGRTFLAPGNGLLERIASGGRGERWYELRAPADHDRVSPTFHGRDVFAPVAARLARGIRPGTVGRRIGAGTPQPLFIEGPAKGTSARGIVLHIDRFGNVITNIRVAGVRARRWSARISGRDVHGPFRTYDEAPRGIPFLLRGSSGLLEVSVRRGNAAKLLRVRIGSNVTLKSL